MSALVYTYAILLAVGGIIGYLKAGSTPSLVMGVLSGLAVGYSANLTVTNRRLGTQLTLVLSVILLLIMGSRYYNSQKFMPAGLVALFSLIVAFKTFLSYSQM